MSAADESTEIGKNSEVNSPTPKRRGRKRKSELVVGKNEEKITPKDKAVSRRGRPRKKVNYYELANPENSTSDVQAQLALSYDEENDESHNKSNNIIVSEISDEANNVTHNQGEISNNSIDDSSVKENDDQISMNHSIDDEASTSTSKNKDRRYTYTGETVKMMNTLFTMFTDKSGTSMLNGTNASGDDTVLKNSNNNGKRQYRLHKTVKDLDLDDGSGNVTCAICKTTLNKTTWLHHKQRYHNNLAWRVGDSPLDLNDQSLVMHTLNMLYKKKKPLYCDKCGDFKKSVVGFLSHRSQCLKSGEQLDTVKIACEICGRKTLPVSMSTHMRIHQNAGTKEANLENERRELSKPVSSKRSAAKKALRMIENVSKDHDKYVTSNLNLESEEFAKELLQKELEETKVIECKFNCNQKSHTLADAFKHREDCELKLIEGFMCKICLFSTAKLEDLIYHVESIHEVSVDGDEEFEFLEREEKETKMPTFLRRGKVRNAERVLYPLAFEWTLKFQNLNFTNSLFQGFFNNITWPLLSPDLVKPYLPTLNESCDVARTYVKSFINPLHDEYTFKKYKLFESEIHKDNKITLFCGGPVSSMAWLPTPHTKDDENQILAVSVLNSPNAKYLTFENYKASNAIQFWNFGRLKNAHPSLSEPKLAFSVVHEHGPVWHMEWCPSGCYNVEEERLGLLAVTGSDSVVYIYAIPSLNEDVTGLFYKPIPVAKLLLQRPGHSLLGDVKYYPSRLSWSKASGHQHLAVGYSNGFVAVFNITAISPVLKYKDWDGINCILPSKFFQAHSHSITALALYHLNEGCRWLMTGSMDRGVCLWDLEDYNYPICMSKRNIVTDGFWFTNWLCHVCAADEGSTSMHVTAILKQARDFVSETCFTMTCSPSTISAVSGSDWLNAMLHGNTVGEIVAIFPHQILHLTDQLKFIKSRRMLFGYTYLVEKNKTPTERVKDDKLRKKALQNLMTKKASRGVKLSMIKSDIDCKTLFVNESVTYEGVEEKYGLLFCDNKMESYDDFPATTTKQLSAFSKDYATTHPNQYPLTAVNKIVFNPNRQASLYYAAGYQAGFLRISWMEFLKNDQQIK